MPAPDKLRHLVETFGNNLDDYKSGAFNEAQARQQFINPLFKLLGWDMDNEAGLAEAYKDVIHEASIKIGGATKAPDYCFRIGKERKFFVEAKKPSVKVKDDPVPAYQLRRYAWTAKLPLSIVTDFEEFAVYDCRIKPDPKDKASTARIRYFTFHEYVEKWDEIAGIFSKDAILKGSFDKYAETAKGKRGTATVDAAFLREIESWRELFAKDIAKNNPNLDQRELNYAVQVTIDRIIFLRMCEDRGIEQYSRLLALVNGPKIYERLKQQFREADHRYNSGLFYFDKEKDRAEPPDDLTPRLKIGDEPLKKIIKGLYYPECPYEFGVLPVEILGQVYEQFLGKVIRLTASHQAKIEDKPEVKKAGGVYYTPRYIVDYIVEHTVGRLLNGEPTGLTPSALVGEGGGGGASVATPHPNPPPQGGREPEKKGDRALTPKQAAKLRILDPACGSGSFLLGAYQFLLDWHRDWYVADGPEQHAKELYKSTTGEWRLTTAERKRILLNNVYGVDIDPQAVEVTKLSLLLKVLEGETNETLQRQLFAHERALPDLASNIKCGNSLIGPDFYDGNQLTMFDEEERLRVNVFDWHAAFPAIMKAGGFDAVIGNPPYRRELDYKHLMDEIARSAIGKLYRAPRMDLWYYFIHRGLELIRTRAVLSFITNAYWTAGTGSAKLIATLRDDVSVLEIFFFGKLKVFDRVSGQHMIMRICNDKSSSNTNIKLVSAPGKEKTAEPFVRGTLPVSSFQKSRSALFHDGKVDLQPVSEDLLSKLSNHTRLGTLGAVRQGIAENPSEIGRKANERFGGKWRIGQGVFALREEELAALRLTDAESSLLRPYHDLSDLGRYSISSSPSRTLIYSTPKTCPDINQFPKLFKHLTQFKPIMEQRRETLRKVNSWWHLHWPRDEAIWMAPKVISIQMGRRPSFVPSGGPTYVPFSVNVFVPSQETQEHRNYITGILNSKALWKWFDHNAKRRGAGLEINGNVLQRAPIRRIDFSNQADKSRHDRLVAHVEQMLALHKQLAKAKSPPARSALEHQIAATDRQIDRLVYDLYGLTEEEIRIVEEGTGG